MNWNCGSCGAFRVGGQQCDYVVSERTVWSLGAAGCVQRLGGLVLQRWLVAAAFDYTLLEPVDCLLSCTCLSTLPQANGGSVLRDASAARRICLGTSVRCTRAHFLNFVMGAACPGLRFVVSEPPRLSTSADRNFNVDYADARPPSQMCVASACFDSVEIHTVDGTESSDGEYKCLT